MSGNNDSTAKGKMDFVIKVLDEYESNIGLPLYFDNEEFEKTLSYEDIKEYTSYSNEELNNLDIEECGNIQYQLSKFALQIQRLLNRETQREQWCNSELYKMIGKSDSYNKYLKMSEKIYYLINEDVYASKVNEIREYAQYRLTRLNFISLLIKELGENLRNIQKIKERAYNG